MRALTLLSLSVWLSACEMPQSREALAGPTRPFGGTPHPIPGRIEAEDFICLKKNWVTISCWLPPVGHRKIIKNKKFYHFQLNYADLLHIHP